MSCCILSLVTVIGQYKYIILYMREWLSGGASPCQGEGRGFDPRLALLFCPKVVRYLVYRKVVHCVTDHVFVQREVRSTSRTHAKQGFGSPPPEVGLGRFGGKKVHRTFFASASPRLVSLLCPKVVRCLVYINMVHCVTDHVFVQREVRSTSRTHAKQGFGSPPPKVGLGRFGGKKVHRTFFCVRLTPSRVFSLPKSGPLFSVQ